MELMKRKLCFRITAKLENSKRQHCLWQERKKNNAGPTIQKSPWKEKKKKVEEMTKKKKCPFIRI